VAVNANARLSALVFTVSALAWSTSQAQQQGQTQALVLVAHNLMAADSAHRALARHGGDASAMLPGDLMSYDLRFTNLLRDSVQRVTFDNPMPHGMHYVAQSAKASRQDVIVEFSIDSGRSYSATPMIEREVNGRKVREAAPPESYTHVRWRISGWVRPGVQVTAQFRAKYDPNH
jgi:uncharacterized repeat protein (TIGR01451 family)